MVRRSEAGYTLLVLVVFISVMTVALLIALPVWETQMRREREEELQFRGRQYVEAVRRFTAKNPGAYPRSIEDLVKERYLRKAFRDPMTKDGAWNIILASGRPGRTPERGREESFPGASPRLREGRPREDRGPGGRPEPGGGAPGSGAPTHQEVMIVPEANLKAVSGPRIIGVVSPSPKKSFLIFEEGETYDAWLFYYGKAPGSKPEIIRFGDPLK